MTTQKKSFESIVVGLDFSEYSKLVFKQAQVLAKEFHAKITAVYARTHWLMVDDAARYGIPEEAQFDTQEMKDSLRKFYRIKGPVELVVERGAPLEVLNKVAKSKSRPLIVIGSQGTGLIGRFLLGSNAEQVALNLPFPVWVHKGESTVPLRKALVPMDLSGKNRKALDMAQDWFGDSKVKMESVFVRSVAPLGWEARAYQQILKMERDIDRSLKNFETSYPEVSLHVVSGDPAKKINSLSKKFDFLVMAPHNRYGMQSMFGKVSTKTLRLSQKPLLIVKPVRTRLPKAQATPEVLTHFETATSNLLPY